MSKVDKLIYEDTKNTLKEFMIGTKEEGKNWGEVVSLSMAKTLAISYGSTPGVLIFTFM